MEVQAVGYYGSIRQDLVDWLPRPLGRVLDVGCGEAASADALRAAGATSITGIEVVAGAAETARDRLDELYVGTVEEQLPNVTGPFDTSVHSMIARCAGEESRSRCRTLDTSPL
jgi:predicted TPR repeat methyltransferase